MISDVLEAIERGVTVVRLNTRFLLLAVLLFVFPLLFVWVTQSYFLTAYDNINTVQKSKINLLHDSLAALLTSTTTNEEIINAHLAATVAHMPEITKIQFSAQDADGFIVRFSSDLTTIGTYEASDQLYRELPLAVHQAPFIYETRLNNERVWQSFTKVASREGDLYLFSEHRFGQLDSVMNNRQLTAHFTLASIFLFLLILAYWLTKQVNWEQQYHIQKSKMEERDQFVDMIAHELRSPLTAVRGYAGLLQESETISSEDMRYVQNIQLSASRLIELVNDFLEVARIQAGKLSVRPVPTDVAKVVDEVIAELTSIATEKHLSLTTAIPSQALILSVDPDRLTQILTNIISNSLKYTKHGGVTVTGEQRGDTIIIRIKDTGTGISAEDQQKLFVPFTRVGNVDQDTAITGSGLGMWITRQLVELLGGTVGVESISGVGTHVVLTFKKQ